MQTKSLLLSNEKLTDLHYVTGLILAAFSALVFGLSLLLSPSATPELGSFPLNFLITVVYFIVLLTTGALKRGRNGLHHMLLFLILFLISAYALNREMLIFQTSVTWFAVVLVIVCINYISFIFFSYLPVWIRHVISAISGVAMITFLYLAIYLLPIYFLSGVAFLALGISLHAFVPLLFCIYTFVLMRRVNNGTYQYWISFCAAILVCVICITTYAIKWNKNLSVINDTYRTASVTANDRLPVWVAIAQHIKDDDISLKILKTDLVYSTPERTSSWLWDMPTFDFEDKSHDPLVMISSFFSGPVNITVDDRVKVLETMYDARHATQERLWSGKNLVTEQVKTDVQLWEPLRIAYTEMSVTVAHILDHHSWSQDQEAIYTFHLPEGGVVTSLSLWVNGNEEKGILTTKSKADSAYKTIVGIQRRDPSVVHWQEGNTVSVRVYPVAKGQVRKFKMGITSPLVIDSNKLFYKNISFEGPSSIEAESQVTVFSGKDQLRYTKGKYEKDWSIALTSVPLTSATFNFDSSSYTLQSLSIIEERFEPKTIYLDVNSSWTKDELTKVFSLVKDQKVFVNTGDERLVQVQGNISDELVDELLSKNFSLFPFYKIDDSNSSLVIGKSGTVSPTIDDLRAGTFISTTHKYFVNNHSIKFFNIGNQLSPYLKSLREFRMLQYKQGNVDELEQQLSRKVFPRTKETDDEIAVYDAGISIKRSNETVTSTAPDHLMRLFAYNHVLSKAGKGILADKLDEQPLIDEAEKAYVVTPFSSLIVLETQKDYDRFDIKSSKDSLKNASLESKGSVPEPHEWALIILVVLLAGSLKFYPKLATLIKR